tara:strand:- start:116 stop:325 length:210 start_codon:yes stop_codon:yes gene_type:complete
MPKNTIDQNTIDLMIKSLKKKPQTVLELSEKTGKSERTIHRYLSHIETTTKIKLAKRLGKTAPYFIMSK